MPFALCLRFLQCHHHHNCHFLIIIYCHTEMILDAAQLFEQHQWVFFLLHWHSIKHLVHFDFHNHIYGLMSFVQLEHHLLSQALGNSLVHLPIKNQSIWSLDNACPEHPYVNLFLTNAFFFALFSSFHLNSM